MPNQQQTLATASCRCGNVEIKLFGTPITSVVCYCDDCQNGSRQIENLPNAEPILDSNGGATYALYRKDRIQCSKGAEFLRGYKIKDASATSRFVATCCNSFMNMSFDDARHWVPVHRARIQPDAPPLRMRICTKFKSGSGDLPGDVPSYPGYPLKFMGKLIAAWIPMLLRR
jgi:hypothetical protein